MPTLVATIAAPTNIDSIWECPQYEASAHPARKGTRTPERATRLAVQPLFKRSDRFTCNPARNKRNIKPSSVSSEIKLLGESHPKTLGPSKTPATIWPTIPG